MATDIALRGLPDSLVQRLQEQDALSVIGTLEEAAAERLEQSVREIRSRWR